MPERVITSNEISIDGNRYRLIRPVQSTTAQYPGKIVIGDISSDSHPHLSVIRWSGAQGGIGKKDHDGAVDVSRLWYGTSHLRVGGHRTLPDLATTTSASGVDGVLTVDAIAELSSEIYAAFATSIRKYAFNTDSWGSNLHTLAAGATDSLTTRLADTVYMIFAYATGYVDTTDGSTFNNRTTDVKYIAAWDDRLWGIDNTGQLRWAFNPAGTWTDDAQLPLPSDYVQDLFVGRDASGNHILYASTKVGLFAHDAENNKFVVTELDLPFHDSSGAGVDRWRDSTYIPAGLGIYKYALGGGGAVISTVGPDKEQGLPASRRGKIVGLHKTHNDLIAVVDSTSAGAESLNTWAPSGAPGHQSPAMNASTGRSLVLGWNEMAWQVLFESGAQTEAITKAFVSNAYGGYRFWFGHNRRVKYFSLPVDVVNPSEISDRVYAAASRDESPWFDAGQAEINKLAVRLRVEVANASSNNYVTLYYGTNYDDDTWTKLTDTHTSDSTFDADNDRITGNGITTFSFPATTTPTGLDFRSIRWRTDLARGGDTSKSPDVRSITLEYRKKTEARCVWTVELDVAMTYKGRSAKRQREDLLSAIQSNSLVEFTYRDDTGDTRNFYVDIKQPTSLEQTGHKETGITRLTLVQT